MGEGVAEGTAVRRATVGEAGARVAAGREGLGNGEGNGDGEGDGSAVAVDDGVWDGSAVDDGDGEGDASAVDVVQVRGVGSSELPSGGAPQAPDSSVTTRHNTKTRVDLPISSSSMTSRSDSRSIGKGIHHSRPCLRFNNPDMKPLGYGSYDFKTARRVLAS